MTVEKAGFDLIWFSIFIVLLVAWASLPFFFMMVLCVVLITLFPQLCTWLPDLLIGVTRK